MYATQLIFIGSCYIIVFQQHEEINVEREMNGLPQTRRSNTGQGQGKVRDSCAPGRNEAHRNGTEASKREKMMEHCLLP
jgi:hypothetical protein